MKVVWCFGLTRGMTKIGRKIYVKVFLDRQAPDLKNTELQLISFPFHLVLSECA